jgi:hypothetical protein
MKPENMPYYQGPLITTSTDLQHANTPLETCQLVSDTANTSHCQSLFSEMGNHNCHSLCHLAHVPVCFGEFKHVTPLDAHEPSNHETPVYAIRVLQFNWAVYSFGGGHFASTISLHNYPFNVTLACNNYEHGCTLFHEFLPYPHLFSSGNEMLHHIRALGDISQVHGYLIHSLGFQDSKTTSTFWQLQSSIAAQLWTLRTLQMIVAVIIPDHNGCCIKTFQRQLKSKGWCISQFDDVFFPNLGDTITGQCDILIGIHSSCASHLKPLKLKPPPPVSLHPLGAFLLEPFNRLEHLVSLACNKDDFCCQDIKFHVTNSPTEICSEPGITIRYFLNCFGTNESILC